MHSMAPIGLVVVLFYLGFFGLVIYTLFLLIKALRIYIRNNENKDDDRFKGGRI